jgi:opacity protein-like surface antigen
MFRKLTCALVAVAALSTVALAPSAASARGYHGFSALYLQGHYTGPYKGFCWRPYAYVCQ